MNWQKVGTPGDTPAQNWVTTTNNSDKHAMGPPIGQNIGPSSKNI